MSNGLEKYPKLRFPGFGEPIQAKKLSRYLIENTDRNKALKYDKSDVLSVSGEFGIVNQIAFQGRSFAGESVAEYHIVETDDIVYTKSPLKANPYGIIKVNNGNPGIVSTLYAVYHPIDVIPQYIDYYFCNDLRLNKYLKPLVNIGAKHDMKVNNAAVLFGDVYFPNATEQSKIVEFLQILDYRIKKQRALVESLKKYKRGLSDKIFSTIVITSNCKKISWKNVFLPLQNNTFSRDDLIQYGGTVRDIHYGDILVKYGATVNLSSVDVPCIKPEKDISKFSINSYLQNGDIVIADTAEDYSVGKATEIIGSNGIMALSGLHTIPCRPCIEFVPMYLGYYLNSSYFRKQIYPMVQGTKVSSISKSEIAKTEILVPSQ